jgi:methylglyoxal synthase
MEIAIIAHDGKKETLIEFLQEYRGFFTLPDVHLVATGNTGSLAEKGGFAIEKLLSGPLGGDAQIATRVAEGMTDMVLFFRDPLDKHPHEPDIATLIRLCDVHNVPLGTNQATATLLVESIATISLRDRLVLSSALQSGLRV